jgi:hypothetical protein
MDRKVQEQDRHGAGKPGGLPGRVDAEAAKGGCEPVPSNLRATRSATRRLLQGQAPPRSSPPGLRKA